MLLLLKIHRNHSHLLKVSSSACPCLRDHQLVNLESSMRWRRWYNLSSGKSSLLEESILFANSSCTGCIPQPGRCPLSIQDPAGCWTAVFSWIPAGPKPAVQHPPRDIVVCEAAGGQGGAWTWARHCSHFFWPRCTCCYCCLVALPWRQEKLALLQLHLPAISPAPGTHQSAEWCSHCGSILTIRGQLLHWASVPWWSVHIIATSRPAVWSFGCLGFYIYRQVLTGQQVQTFVLWGYVNEKGIDVAVIFSE